jgi:glycolate oxidase iron-sulfur subunit
MRTIIHERFRGSAAAKSAEPILRACVHCGFCNATCPTYLQLGDERDGPRGRIYLIRQLLENGQATERTRRHLDRCLTCRNCETTCPSGVRYGRLLDIGRGILERDLNRPMPEKLQRRMIEFIVPHPRRFAFVLALARAFRFLLPSALRARVPRSDGWPGVRNRRIDTRPTSTRKGAAATTRRMIVLEGCAQSVATPATNLAAKRVLERLGITVFSARQAGCCGALHYHLGDHADGKDFMRANIDAWWPHLERGAEAIVITASGCAATIRDYGEILADDPEYAKKAQRIASLTRDILEVVRDAGIGELALTPISERVAVHCPCTLQHAQRLGVSLEDLLASLGFDLVRTAEKHLCCGSAGSYSLLQPTLSGQLRDRKLAALTTDSPDVILTGNVGCQMHLATGTDVPVRHWIEAIDASLEPAEEPSDSK